MIRSFLIPALFLLPQAALAFLPHSDLLTISPPVAKAGSTVEVTISGTDLLEISTLRFTEPAIQVQPVRKPADEFFPDGQIVPNQFAVTIPENVSPGVYEVRSLGYFGLSTARPFLVVEKDAVQVAETGNHSTAETAMPIDLESSVTGLLENRKLDWYEFEGTAGQRILAEVQAERLDSRADVLLAIYDSAGRELQSSRHHAGRDPFVDLTLPADGTYRLAVSDTLYRGAKNEYFYRLEVGTSAHLDFAFPPAGEPGTSAPFTLYGRNLPDSSLGAAAMLNGRPLETMEEIIAIPQTASLVPGVFPGTPRQGIVPAFEHRVAGSNPVRIGFATAPVVKEEPGEQIQSLSLPCEVAGRFDEPGDYDRFRFQAKAGETWWVEVISERLGVIADPYVVIEKVTTDEEGKETRTLLVENDDPPSYYGRDALDDLNFNTLDPVLSFTPEEDGEFEITLVNQSAGGSIAHLYRLAIRPAQPGFQLVAGTELTKTINNDAFPMAPVLRRSGSLVYRILATREDGFEGAINITAEGLPPGVSAHPLILDGTATEGFLTLQAGPEAAAWSGPIRILGKASIGDEEIQREARSTSIIWGSRVFANQRQIRSRLDEEIVLSVLDTETEPCRIAPAEDQVWQVNLKDKLEFPIQIADAGNRTGALQVEVFGFPGLLRSPPKVSVPEGASEATLTINFTPSGNFELVPGRHQFVLRGIGNAKYIQNPERLAVAEAEVTRITDLAAAAAEKLKTAQEELKAAEAQLQQAQQAGNDVAAAQTTVETARATLAEAEASNQRATTLKQESEAARKAAADRAKETSSQFATYSFPITVEVLEPEAAE